MIGDLSRGLYEREETIAVALLSAVSGQSLFLYGPPGTAKSLIARRISGAFRDSSYFEYLMQRFSTPEDVFGPVSISELKNDNYVRKTMNYLPTADIAFLDEIWKSSPAILNTLLTIINERTFKNGQQIEKVPLKALLAASNEFPEENSGLDALYDRFIMRMKVIPLQERKNFESMISENATLDTVRSDNAFTMDEWDTIVKEFHGVRVTTEILDIIDRIRTAIGQNNIENDVKIHISDRRWQRSVFIMKASAYLNGRSETSPVDALLLRHCLWSSDSDIDIVHGIVENAISSTGNINDTELKGWRQKFEEVEDSIQDTFFHDRDEYDTVTVGERECFRFVTEVDLIKGKESFTIHIPTEFIKENREFHPLDEHGNADDRFQCNFNANENAVISIDTHYRSYLQGNPFGSPYDRSMRYERISEFVPNINARRGSQKYVSTGTKEAYLKTLDELRSDIAKILKTSEERLRVQKRAVHSPFVPADVQDRLINAMMNDHVNDISNQQMNLERVYHKVMSYDDG